MSHDRRTTVQAWRDGGWLRAIDAALAAFLRDPGGETDETVFLLAALASQQLGQGHICLDLDDALRRPDVLAPADALPDGTDAPGGPAALGSDTTVADLVDRLQRSPVVDTGPGNAPLVVDRGRLYLRRYWQYEQTVAAEVSRLARGRHPVPDDLGQRLDAVFGPAEEGGTDWQKIAGALAARGQLTVLTGGPGTGKTTTVVRLLGLLQSLAGEGGRPLRIRLAAPTGKAAARLTESIGPRVAELPVSDDARAQVPTEVTTLHRLLGRRPGSRHFRHDRRNPVHADVVVVDEASMIDLEMMAGLLEALAPHTRLILLGDKNQLDSVEAGAVLGDLCRGAEAGDYSAATVDWVRTACGEDITSWAGSGAALADCTVMLRTSHRFGADSGIGALARAINDGDPEGFGAVWQREFDDIDRLPLPDIQDGRLEALCVEGYRGYLDVLAGPEPSGGLEARARAALDAFGRFQLLCALRDGPAGVAGLNRRIARALYRQGLIPRDEGWYPGRPVIVTRNDYQLGLMNGDVGMTLAAGEGQGEQQLRVAFPVADGGIRFVLPSRLADVDTAYAMTVHKSQGSEFAHAALVLPEADAPVLTRELLYTAVTRASQRFTLAVPRDEVLAAGLGRRTRRASGLAEAISTPGAAAAGPRFPG